MATDKTERDNTMGRVLTFRPRPSARPRLATRVRSRHGSVDIGGPQNDDLAKYEHNNESDDYGHRMRMNAAAIVVLVLLIAAGVWIANTMAEMQKNQDCVLQGRRNCAPIEIPTIDRR